LATLLTNDASARAWQAHSTQWTAGKNFPATGSFGPLLVTADEVDGRVLSLTTRLNGEVLQDADTTMKIFPIPELIAYVSTFTELQPGDVIVPARPSTPSRRLTIVRWLGHSIRPSFLGRCAVDCEWLWVRPQAVLTDPSIPVGPSCSLAALVGELELAVAFPIGMDGDCATGLQVLMFDGETRPADLSRLPGVR
jgi:hypothetical protein